jgi:hypothetical protein
MMLDVVCGCLGVVAGLVIFGIAGFGGSRKAADRPAGRRHDSPSS